MHPELRLGGAERVAVDAARSLRLRGHTVRVLTAAVDARAFPDVEAVEVVEAARWLPRNVWGRLVAPCTVARMFALAHAARRLPRPDVVLTAQAAHAVPALKAATRAPVVFYAHFPDALLAPRTGGLFAPYRAVLDGLEARGLAAADAVVANSAFTADACARVFGRRPDVLYPGVDLERFGTAAPTEALLVAIQRFDSAKNIGLAIDALARLPARVRLVLLGAVDPRHQRLPDLLAAHAGQERVSDRVTIVENPDDETVGLWLRRASILVYTPVAEHFGLVPVEAMAAGVPVVACSGGGLLETVEDGVTGFLVANDAAAMAHACDRILRDPALARAMSEAGRQRAERFSLARFGDALERLLTSTWTASRPAARP